ncbi:hypothetical protein DL93DRAFT_2069006, partial [Clavulina sp. PMI_390]
QTTEANIWLSILKSKTLSHNMITFLWKVLHRAHKIGPYWTKMQNKYAVRGECQYSKLETMDHILFECP